MKTTLHRIVVLGLLATGVFGCFKTAVPDQLDNYNPIFALPLVNTSFTAKDIFDQVGGNDSIITWNETGLPAIVYKGALRSFGQSDLVTLPDLGFSVEKVLTAGEASTINQVGNLPVAQIQNTTFDTGNDQAVLYSILFESGELVIDFENNQREFLEGTITIDQLKNNLGQPFQHMVVGSPETFGTTSSASFPLAGYTLEFDPADANSFETVVQMLFQNNTEDLGQAGDGFSIDFFISELVFAEIYGDFGNQSIGNARDSIAIQIFTNTNIGNFNVVDALLSLDATNSFGIPLDLEFSEVYSKNLSTGEITTLQAAQNTFEIEQQPAVGSAPAESTFNYDSDNSNIADIFVPAPQEILVAVEAIANPNTNPTPANPNFLTPDSKLDMDVEILLPLSAYVQDISLENIIPVEFASEDFEQQVVDSIQLRVVIENEFPIQGDLQVVFLDENDTPLDSLFQGLQPFIVPSAVNSEGFLESPGINTLNIGLGKELSDNLLLSKKVSVRSVINTTNSANEQYVKILENYALSVKMGIKIFANVEL